MCPLVYFKDYKKCSPFPLHCSWCSIHKSILTECVRWYISETIIVSLLPGTIHDIDYNRYTDRMCSLVYSKDCRNYSPSLSHYSWCSLHTGISTEYVYWYIPENNFSEIYRQNVLVGIFQRLWKLFPFSLTLFTIFITMGIPTECVHWYISKTVGIIPLLSDIVHDVHYIQVYQQNMFVGIFQRLWELFTSQCADNKCSFDCWLFSQQNHRRNEKSLIIFEGAFWKFSWNLKNFHLTLLTEWRVVSNFVGKTKLKDQNQNRCGFIFFFFLLSQICFSLFFLAEIKHSLLFSFYPNVCCLSSFFFGFIKNLLFFLIIS